jgi:N-methylhydantoinase A
MGTRAAVDIGGTFTDLVHLDGDEIGLAKASTTPGRFEAGVMDAVAQAGLRDVEFLAHGTTVVINTLTERSGSPPALLTTRGCRDVLEIAKGNRPDLYNLLFHKPEPFVPRRLRLEVGERIAYTGEVLEALDEDSVREAVDRARALGAEAVAICFLHAYANSEHERRAGELVHELWPEAQITLSHDLTGEWREYHRTSTAVLDAYVKPTVARYLGALAQRLDEAGIGRDTQFAMQSNGGVSRFAVAAEQPIHLVESGPVGGIIGAAAIGAATGRPNVITLDIGGTTAKSSLIERGEVRLSSDYHIERTPTDAGYPIKVPVVDIVEIGAGGGSIAWLDPAGALKVGPRSAGAEPGPASYGLGGTEPTLTDAQVICGRLDPHAFLGGRLPLDPDRACAALAPIAQALGASVEETALGVIRIADANMINLLRLVSVRRGRDPRDFALLACGGGGPLHATTLAAELRVPEVLVPRAPGHFSALGMLMSDLRHDLVRTRLQRLDDIDAAEVDGVWRELEERMLATFADERVAADDVAFVRAADMRYAGQEHAVTVALADGAFDEATRDEVRARFHDAHERLYGFRLDVAAEFVNFRLTGFGAVRKPPLRRLAAARDGAREPRSRSVLLEQHGTVEAEVHDRDGLVPGDRLEGPAIVEEAASTTLLLPGQHLTVDEYGNLEVRT